MDGQLGAEYSLAEYVEALVACSARRAVCWLTTTRSG
jgi:hypothetical protein